MPPPPEKTRRRKNCHGSFKTLLVLQNLKLNDMSVVFITYGIGINRQFFSSLKILQLLPIIDFYSYVNLIIYRPFLQFVQLLLNERNFYILYLYVLIILKKMHYKNYKRKHKNCCAIMNYDAEKVSRNEPTGIIIYPKKPAVDSYSVKKQSFRD